MRNRILFGDGRFHSKEKTNKKDMALCHVLFGIVSILDEQKVSGRTEIEKEDAEGGHKNYYFFMKTLQRFYDTLVEPDTKI